MSTDRGTDKEDVVYIYSGVLLSHKKEWNNAICSNMGGPIDYHTKWSKPEKCKYHMVSFICGLQNKKVQMNLYTNRNRPTDRENKLMATKVEKR